MGDVCSAPTVDRSSEVQPRRGGAAVATAGGGHGLVQSELARGDGEAEELLKIPGAQVVIMGAGGDGGTVAQGMFVFAHLASPSDLSVLFVGQSFQELSEGFYYPLMRETPVCLSGDRIITLDAGGGDIMAINLPKNVSESDLERLMELLGMSGALEVQKSGKLDTVDKVAEGLLKGGTALTGGIAWAAQGLSKGIAKTGEAARNNVGETKEVKVSQKTQMAVSGLRMGTQATVKVSGKVIDGLMTTAVELGKQAGKEAGKEAAKRSGATGSAGNTNAADEKPSGALRVGKAGFLAGAQVFDALLKAGDKLSSEAADEAGYYVGAKYGADAGVVARDAMGITNDVLELQNLVGKKAVGKLAAKVHLTL